MSVTTSLNQVDLEAVGALVGKIQQDPDAARTTWAANVRWAGAFRSESQVRSFPPAASDEPTSLGGSDTAPNPVEQLLSAWATASPSGTPPTPRPPASRSRT